MGLYFGLESIPGGLSAIIECSLPPKPANKTIVNLLDRDHFMKKLDLRTQTLTVFVCTFVFCYGTMLLGDELGEVNSKEPTPEAIDFFESKIRPLLLNRCVECHGDSEPEGELSLESRDGLLRGGKLGPVVTPGKPKESLLISAINHDEFLKMPPKEKLPTNELVLLSKWVAMGAPWPTTTSKDSVTKPIPNSELNPERNLDQVSFTEEQKSFWAYQPLRWPKPSQASTSDWTSSPIDAFVFEKLQAKGLVPAAPTTKQDLIRRATYDLIGLPPTEEEMDAFLNDSSPNPFSAVVDRLLASPRYGEKWGRHWLDVARFADSNGLDENIAYANAFRYRDYVISSFNRDTPYDRFVQEQIAGDLLEPVPAESLPNNDSLDRYVATGFLVIGAKMLAEDDPLKMQMDIIDEQLSTLCQAFMGMTIGCARCHDHKFDPIPTADYYALAGIFKSTKTMENHKVVAKWFERPLATKTQLAEMEVVEREIATSNAAIAKLNQECRARVSKEIQSSIANALMATVLYEKFAAQAKDKLTRGLDHMDRPYPVTRGYALIEAEGFQRGTVIRESENYGKEIGVIISHGAANAEYDIDVQHAGRYAIEFRYAAAERRPVRLLLDGVEVRPSILAETTGSWQPDGQNWFVGGLMTLSAGPHVLKFESKKVFPHIDKFALVFQNEEAWPFDTEPVSLSRSGMDLGITYPVLSLWRSYFDTIRKRGKDELNRESFFSLWLRFRDINDDFESASQQVLMELEAESPLRQQTPSVLRDALLSVRPTSLKQVAGAFEVAACQVLSKDEKTSDAKASDEIGKLRDALLSNASPLSGPKNDIERFHSESERTRSVELEAALAEIKSGQLNPPMAMGVTEAQPEDLKIHLRGSHIVFGKLAKRGFPQILTSTDQTPIRDSASGRLELAQWMTRPDHQLTSRVIVNRIWHWHFGRGIVSSVDNFGLLGQKPTHPELLDWLASQFVANNWSIKHLHRTIMLSQTYQMRPQFQAGAAEIDPENELRWQFQRRRLTGEETRDSIVAVGAGLDATMFGTLMNVENHKYVNSTGAGGVLNYASARRSVYLPVIRSGMFEVLQTLDFPDPAMSTGERQTSTAAPQALLMMNSDLVHEQTQIIAQQLANASMDDAQRISAAYRRILKRPPTIAEIIAAATFLRDARGNPRLNSNEPKQATPTPSALSNEILFWQGLCRVLISSNEFSYVE